MRCCHPILFTASQELLNSRPQRVRCPAVQDVSAGEITSLLSGSVDFSYTDDTMPTGEDGMHDAGS